MNLTNLQEPKGMSYLQPWGGQRWIPDLQARLMAQQLAVEVSVVSVWGWGSFPMHDLITELLLTQSLKPEAATIKAEAPASPTRQAMTPEMEWFTSHAAELAAYKGEWLLVVGRELVAHSADFHTIHTLVQKRGITEPFLYYVSTPEEANFVL